MVDFDSEEMDVERDRLRAILEKQNYSHEQLLNFAAACLASYNAVNKSREKTKELDVEVAKLHTKKDNYHKEMLVALSEMKDLQAALSFHDGMKDGIFLGKKIQIKVQAKKGALGRNAKYQPLKELAAKLVNEKNFNSRRNAASTIKPQILSESARLGIGLSENQAEITITGWLKEMGLPANI